MAYCVEGRNLVLGKIESISRILVGPSQMFDVQEALEKIDQIVDLSLDFRRLFIGTFP